MLKLYDVIHIISEVCFRYEKETNQRLKTASETIGVRPLMSAKSKLNGSLNSPRAWHARKRMDAMTICENRKKRGTSVVFRTHLFL